MSMAPVPKSPEEKLFDQFIASMRRDPEAKRLAPAKNLLA